MSSSKDQLAEAINFCKEIKKQRYRAGIICVNYELVIERLGKSLANKLSAQYFDVQAELLPFIGQNNEYPVLGAYDENDFINQIFQMSSPLQKDFLIIDQIEALLVTFNKQGVIKLFNNIGFLEPKCPIILISYLEKQLRQSNISTKNVMYI